LASRARHWLNVETLLVLGAIGVAIAVFAAALAMGAL
jgi:hypothetical protein